MACYRYVTIYETSEALQWLESLLGGCFVHPSPEKMLAEDGSDVLWFTDGLHPELDDLLLGRRILVPPAFGVRRWIDQPHAGAINRHFEAVFETGYGQMHHHHRHGTWPEKIREAGHFPLFTLPKRPVRPDAILFSSKASAQGSHDKTMLSILRDLDSSVQGYVWVDRAAPSHVIGRYQELCGDRRNLRWLETAQDLREACAFCVIDVDGGLSSLMAAFWFQDKPVVLVEGNGYNPWVSCWERLRREADCPLFDAVLEESVKISKPQQFDARALLQEARPCVSAKKLFYPWNFDERLTAARVKRLIAELERGMPSAETEEGLLIAA